MNPLKELLAQLLADGVLNDEQSAGLTEAADFGVADYEEQLATLAGERDTASAAAGDANTQVAALTEQINALGAEINAVKAMKLDELLNGSTGAAATSTETTEDGDDDPDGEDLSIDALIEQSQTPKE